MGDIKNVKKIGVNRYEPEPEVNRNRPCCEPKPYNSNRTEPLQPCFCKIGTIDIQYMCPLWASKMAIQNGYPRWVFEWVPKSVTQKGLKMGS